MKQNTVALLVGLLFAILLALVVPVAGLVLGVIIVVCYWIAELVTQVSSDVRGRSEDDLGEQKRQARLHEGLRSGAIDQRTFDRLKNKHRHRRKSE